MSTTGARNYFNNSGKFPRFTNNYYGATIGGPIIKDRTFFFGDFLRYNNHSSAYNLFYCADGRFSQRRLERKPEGGLRSGDRQIWTERDGSSLPATRSRRRDSARWRRAILTRLPLPNIPGAGTVNNYQENLGFDQDSSQFDVKFDQRSARKTS